MERTEALNSIKQGWIAGSVSAGLSLLVVTAAIIGQSESLALWNDSWNYLDVALIATFAFGVYHKSRTAAIFLLIYFVIAKILIAVETGSISGSFVSLIFIFFFIQAIRGTFAWHRIEKQENPDYKRPSKLWLILGIPGGTILTAFIGLALFASLGGTPSTKVLSHSEIPADEISVLKENGIVTEQDKVTHFYSQGFQSIMESGNLMTQDRVILYISDEDDGLQVYQLYFDEITAVVQEQVGDAFNDSIYLVQTSDPERWLKLFLSTEEQGDRTFVKALQQKIPNTNI